jgi:hypothetical protein
MRDGREGREERANMLERKMRRREKVREGSMEKEGEGERRREKEGEGGRRREKGHVHTRSLGQESRATGEGEGGRRRKKEGEGHGHTRSLGQESRVTCRELITFFRMRFPPLQWLNKQLPQKHNCLNRVQ